MMSSKKVVKDILDAINSVRSRVRTATKAGDLPEAHKLMGDLYALEVCLVIETSKLIEEMEILEMKEAA